MRFLPTPRSAFPFDPASLNECKETSPFSSFEIAIRNRYSPEAHPLKQRHDRDSTADSRSSYASAAPLLGSWYGSHSRTSSYLETGSYRPSYDEGTVAKVLAAFGLVLSFLIGASLLFVGVDLCINRTTAYKVGEAEGWRLLPLGSIPAEVLPLPLFLVVTLVTEATGFAHGTALKWQLLKERRLEFNASLRFMTASGGWINGRIMNIILFITLVATNSSTSFVFVSVQGDNAVLVSYLPLIILGIAIIIQAGLSTIAVVCSNIPTWSGSIVDVGPALLAQDITWRIPGRCMRGIDDGHPIDQTPVLPRERHPTLWEISSWRESVRLIVIFPVILAVLFLVGFAFMMHRLRGDWSVWKNLTQGVTISGYGSGVLPATRLGWAFAVICIVQTPVALALHVSELTVLMYRDEANWKSACKKGARSLNPIMTVIGSWASVLLLIVKPVCHWVSGTAVNFQVLNKAPADSGFTAQSALTIRPLFVVVLAGLLFGLSLFVFIIAIRRPTGYQPVTYGHLQTLINLVDEWSPVMYWGHKYTSEICHAGTSTLKLPPVNPDYWYQ
ncbi:hypothetical protein NEOLEDRAFT_718243 [Neolentinus lepideus HHB14362 ss-1]|uniref:Uncharacterized protein n=1 Tax=Neolentinus lepideus HHB14362 ss-1 TaxID=1314782 RepID=A0A165Q5F7_9AGAM|nr:hypothetical protein NEOLEDRAFT_718243 [Neolentinus lepideus HHB14362 ss-1]